MRTASPSSRTARAMRVVCLAVTLGRHVVPAHRPTPPRASGAPSAPLDSAVAARGSAPIFCNRAVNLGRIDAIGFDMDHTLAQYVSRPFDLLAYNGAKERLVDFGYPEAVRDFHYDEHRFQRGLVIDKAQGNVLKMDRHKYVKVAHHGLTEMSAEQRKAQYDTQRPAFTPPEFANIDTAFLLVDVCLYTQLVEYSDAHPGAITRSYAQMYADVRRSVDLCHCDGVIKDVVMANPAGYIERDPQLAALLLRVRASGKKVFLLTNSLWDYTEAVMKHLLAADAAKHSLTDWTDFFDVVIVGARKPAFLLDGNLPIFRVSPEDGSLANLENAAFAAGPDSVHKILAAGRVFQGGNWNHLHSLLGLSAVDKLLYVGDHMYSDVLRAKRTLGWRTMLVVPELEKEMAVRAQHAHLRERIASTRARLHALETELAELEVRAFDAASKRERFGGALDTDGADAVARESVRAELTEAKAELAQQVLDYHRQFHPTWGQLFKTGYQNSRFAQQVEDYACLYTSRASNLAAVSPNARFHTLVDVMPHDGHH